MNELIQELINYAKLNFISSCTFKHYACTFNKNKILSYGFNHSIGKNFIHAEVDAINNLPSSYKKRLNKINILVIRLNKSFQIKNSKCCMKCCETIYRIPPLRGYTISNVYYSNSDGNIEQHHPISLLLEQQYYKTLHQKAFSPKFKYRDNIIKNPNKNIKFFLSRNLFNKKLHNIKCFLNRFF